MLWLAEREPRTWVLDQPRTGVISEGRAKCVLARDEQERRIAIDAVRVLAEARLHV